MSTQQNQKRRAGPKPAAGITVGNVVASNKGLLEGVDPFSALVVTGIAKNGRLTVQLVGGKREWTNVLPSAVVKVADSVG